MLEETALLLGKVNGLQRGYTTGTTAQAACRGAAEMALSGLVQGRTRVILPEGLTLPMELEECRAEKGRAYCGVRKDPGDDKDVTKGMLVCAEAILTDEPGITIAGGPGVGQVTREGLAVPPGEPAINPVPRRMITGDLEELCPPGKGWRVTVSLPDGEELAKKTWNPRLGITGGLSIIGTTGIVEPKSDAAYKASIDVWVNMSHAYNPDYLCLTLGYVGEKALARVVEAGASGELEERMAVTDPESVVKCGDHVGHTIGYACEKGFRDILLIGHIGKLVKLALGIFNTHWKSGDGRLETLAALAGVRGADRELMSAIMELKLAEEAVPLLEELGFSAVFHELTDRILAQIEKRYGGARFGVVLVNLEGRILAQSGSLQDTPGGGKHG